MAIVFKSFTLSNLTIFPNDIDLNASDVLIKNGLFLFFLGFFVRRLIACHL